MLMHNVIRSHEDTLSTDIRTMEMDYDVWIYNRMPDIQSGLLSIEIYSSSRLDLV